MIKQNLPDWDAFGTLQEHYLTCSEIFSIESCEFAMDRCLTVPSRKAVGSQLAKDLLRDGRRSAKSVNDFTAFNEDAHEYGTTTQPEYELRQVDPPKKALLTLTSFFRFLSNRDREVLLLALKGITYTNPSLHKYTDIGARLFRHILTKIRLVIQSDNKLKQSFYSAINIWGYKPQDFITLINQ